MYTNNNSTKLQSNHYIVAEKSTFYRNFQLLIAVRQKDIFWSSETKLLLWHEATTGVPG